MKKLHLEKLTAVRRIDPDTLECQQGIFLRRYMDQGRIYLCLSIKIGQHETPIHRAPYSPEIDEHWHALSLEAHEKTQIKIQASKAAALARFQNLKLWE